MITVNVKTGEIVPIAESNAPIPHSLSRTVTKSTNFGMADEARKTFQPMGRGRGRGRVRDPSGQTLPFPEWFKRMMKEKVEQSEESTSQVDAASIAKSDNSSNSSFSANRSNETEMSGSTVCEAEGYICKKATEISISTALKADEETHVVCNLEERDSPLMPSCSSSTSARNDGGGFPPRGDSSFSSISESFAALKVSPLSKEKLPQSKPPTISGVVYPLTQFKGEFGARKATAPKSSSKGKPNGYIMFLHHMKRTSGTDCSGNINDLIRVFDPDWKALSEEERNMWKERAKSERGREAAISAQRSGVA